MTAKCTNELQDDTCDAKVDSSEHIVPINNQDGAPTESQDNNADSEDTTQEPRLRVGELQLCAHCVVMTGIVGVLFIFLGPILLPTMPTVGMVALIVGGVLAITSSVGCGLAYASQRRHQAMRLCLPERTAINRLQGPPARSAIFSQPIAPPAGHRHIHPFSQPSAPAAVHCHTHPYHHAPHPAVLNIPSSVSPQQWQHTPNEEPPSYSSLFPDNS